MIREVATRDIKLSTIRLSVEACSKERVPALKERLIAECSKRWGTRRQSAQELIKELETREEVWIDGEEIWSYARGEKIKEAREKDYTKSKGILNGY